MNEPDPSPSPRDAASPDTPALSNGVPSDAELILATRAGDADAFSQLYVRHIDSARAAARALTRSKSDSDDIVAEAFARVLAVLQRGGGPDVSFRPYLLTSLRNAYFDKSRRTRREEVTEQIDDAVNLSLLDAMSGSEDRDMVATAFATLPERWQLVLWHTEVEGHTAAEVAPLLGLAPNAVAALAYRAREGLRTAYLQSHLQRSVSDDCRECASNLGAYVRDGLTARERAKVDKHLATCNRCPTLLVELGAANNRLRAVLIPLIVGVSASKYLAALGTKSTVSGLLRSAGKTARAKPLVTTAVAVATVALLSVVAFAAAGGSQPPRSASHDLPAAVTTITTAAPAPPSSLTKPPATTAPAITANLSPTTVAATPPITTPNTDPVAAVVDPVTSPTTPGTTPGTTAKTTATTATPTTATRSTTTPTTATTAAPTTSTTVAPTTTTSPTTVSAAQPQLAVGAEVVAPGLAGFSSIVRVNLANGATLGGTAAPRTAAPAKDVRVTLPLPSGVTFESDGDPNVTCAAGASLLTCSLPALDSGQATSFDLWLNVGSAPFTLTPSVSANGAAPVSAAGGLTVPVTPLTGAVSADYDHGRVVASGNSSMTCDTAVATCAAARAGSAVTAGDLNRQAYTMVDVNEQTSADSDGHVPFNSSTAALDLGRDTVTRAFLMYGGDTAGTTTTAPNPAADNHVRVTTPDGTFHDVTAAVTTYGDTTRYTAIADVT
ncbi:MAG TPA: sigma-70 family RNA polymerase sigma factor, partial [Ilumatobacteraceae bacterium]